MCGCPPSQMRARPANENEGVARALPRRASSPRIFTRIPAARSGRATHQRGTHFPRYSPSAYVRSAKRPPRIRCAHPTLCSRPGLELAPPAFASTCGTRADRLSSRAFWRDALAQRPSAAGILPRRTQHTAYVRTVRAPSAPLPRPPVPRRASVMPASSARSTRSPALFPCPLFSQHRAPPECGRNRAAFAYMRDAEFAAGIRCAPHASRPSSTTTLPACISALMVLRRASSRCSTHCAYYMSTLAPPRPPIPARLTFPLELALRDVRTAAYSQAGRSQAFQWRHQRKEHPGERRIYSLNDLDFIWILNGVSCQILPL
ncbi:hypothetical protein FB451DRAFT_1404249 [Mycena latifolia]|nr:hypothetical protein FB451DRAFT_1404249 [Mycena latifolia]